VIAPEAAALVIAAIVPPRSGGAAHQRQTKLHRPPAARRNDAFEAQRRGGYQARQDAARGLIGATMQSCVADAETLLWQPTSTLSYG
jgi:hypothetical protein